MGKSRMKKSAADRFWEKVDRQGDDECWEWMAAQISTGYGHMCLGDTNVLAHRFSWVEAGGELRPHHEVHHVCRNRLCVNPAHLEQVSMPDHGERHRRDTCRNGHSFDGVSRSQGKVIARYCKTCQNARRRENRRNEGWPLPWKDLGAASGDE